MVVGENMGIENQTQPTRRTQTKTNQTSNVATSAAANAELSCPGREGKVVMWGIGVTRAKFNQKRRAFKTEPTKTEVVRIPGWGRLRQGGENNVGRVINNQTCQTRHNGIMGAYKTRKANKEEGKCLEGKRE